MIDHNSPVPKYCQVKDIVRARIESGQWPHGSKLPVEPELMAEFGVSRFTVKQALGELVRAGLIERARGRGTFVCHGNGKTNKPAATATQEIGLLAPDFIISRLFPPLHAGVEEICADHDYQLVPAFHDHESDKERRLATAYADRGAAGVVIFSSFDSTSKATVFPLQQAGIPFVFVDSSVEGLSADLVACDSGACAYEGTRALANAGARTMAYITGFIAAATSRERLTGFRRALTDARLSTDEELFAEGPFTREFGYDAAKRLLASHPEVDGLFIANEPLLMGVLKAVQELGLDIPHDLKICSFDTPGQSMAYLYPLITIRQPMLEIGRTATRLLFKRIDARRGAVPMGATQCLLLPGEVRVPDELRSVADRTQMNHSGAAS